MHIHFEKEAIALFDATADEVFKYMRVGGHRHLAFKSHESSVGGDEVTLAAEIYGPDEFPFQATMTHRLDPPTRTETTIAGGLFDCAQMSSPTNARMERRPWA